MRVSSIRVFRAVLVMFAAAGSCFSGAAQAQGLLELDADGDFDLPIAPVVGDVDPFGASMNRATLMEAAEMKTDSGSQEILAQAGEFVKQGRYDLASILWQRVIDESGDQVFTRDEWKERTSQNEYRKYRSVSGDIEATLAGLPPEGLAAYRLKADGEARALMNAADSNNRESALAEIVRRFFLSQLGDEAAFELACLKLDREEFLPAARLLAKIASDYPDPTVRRGEIQVRLAAVNARIGNTELAREIIGEIKSQAIPPVPVAVIQAVETDIEQLTSNRIAAADRVGAWTMPQGSPMRSGLMPAPPAAGEAGMIRAWQQRYKLTLPEGEGWDVIGDALAAADEDGKSKPDNDAIIRLLNQDPFGRQLTSQPQEKAASDPEIIEKWLSNGWFPVGQILMDQGKVYFKTDDRIVCCDAESGELKWFGFRGEYPEDPISAVSANSRRYGRVAADSGRPSGAREVISFSDTLNQSMSIIGEKLLVVQGRAVDFYEDGDLDEAGIDIRRGVQARVMRFGGVQQTADGRARKNRLFAYHATSGILSWTLKAGDMMPESKRSMAFAGSPVPYGSLAVVPVYEATSLWLFGIDPENGAVLWKSFLADEPANQTATNSPVRVAIDGGEAYVATGAGVIASVDAISGTLNWAVAYPRTAPSKTNASDRNRRLYVPQQVELDGWVEDTVIPSGNAIVFAASDFNHLVALDRRSGSLLWESARRPIEGEPECEYVLGIAGGKVCVAGRHVVRAYKVKGGRLLWEYRLDQPSYGRGMLTSAGIYIPLEKSIVRLALEDGEVIETLGVESGDSSQPLGNLYSDGDRIYSAGFRQLSSLRVRKEGETIPSPSAAVSPTTVEPAEKTVGLVTHLSLAIELQTLLDSAYAQFAGIKDAQGAKEAGEAFDEAGEKLAALAIRMETQGIPDPKTRGVIEELFFRANAKNAGMFTTSIGRILTVEGVGGDIVTKVVNLHKKAENLPILKAYGIDIERFKAAGNTE